MPSEQMTADRQPGIHGEQAGYDYRGTPRNSGARAVVIRTTLFAASGIFVLALVGLAVGPSTGAATVAMWLLVLVSAAVLMGAGFFGQGLPDRLDEGYGVTLRGAGRDFGRFEEPSARDWFTGLLTPAEFGDAVRIEFARSERYGRRMSLAFIEPDREAIGAFALRDGWEEAAARFMADGVSLILREMDLLGQRDGFGLAALLPETDAAGAAVVAERITGRFERSLLTLRDGEQSPVAVTVAVASYPEDEADAATLLELVESRAFEGVSGRVDGRAA